MLNILLFRNNDQRNRLHSCVGRQCTKCQIIEHQLYDLLREVVIIYRTTYYYSQSPIYLFILDESTLLSGDTYSMRVRARACGMRACVFVHVCVGGLFLRARVRARV